MRNHLDLTITLLADGNGVAKVTGSAVDLDAIVEELLKRGEVENLVVHGLGGIDDELFVAIVRNHA